MKTEMNKPANKFSKKNLTLYLLALAGLMLMVYIIKRIGIEAIIFSLRQITLGQFFILFGLRLAYWLLRSLCWYVVFSAHSRQFTFWDLFTARMAGHAISQLTPTSQIGSEATRMMMVASAGRKISLSSIIIDKSIELLTVTGFTLLTLPILFQRISLPLTLQSALLLPVVFFFSMAIFLMFRQKKGLFNGFLALAAKLHIRSAFLEKNREKIKQTDQLITQFYTDHRHRFLLTTLLYSFLLILWVSDFLLNIIFLDLPGVTILESALVTLGGNLIFILSFVPGSLGIYEATYIGLFSLFGRPAQVAFSLVFMRRVLALLLSVFGLLPFIRPHRRNQIAGPGSNRSGCQDSAEVLPAELSRSADRFAAEVNRQI